MNPSPSLEIEDILGEALDGLDLVAMAAEGIKSSPLILGCEMVQTGIKEALEILRADREDSEVAA